MSHTFSIHNSSPTKYINITVKSIDDTIIVEKSLGSGETINLDVKDGVCRLIVAICDMYIPSAFREKTCETYWSGFIPTNISKSIIINPDQRMVSYNGHVLVNTLQDYSYIPMFKELGLPSLEKNGIYLIVLILLIIVAIWWMYKKTRGFCKYMPA